MRYCFHCVVRVTLMLTARVESGCWQGPETLGVQGLLTVPNWLYPTPPMKKSTTSPPFLPRAQNVKAVAPERSMPAFASVPKLGCGALSPVLRTPFWKTKPPNFVPVVSENTQCIEVAPECFSSVKEPFISTGALASGNLVSAKKWFPAELTSS